MDDNIKLLLNMYYIVENTRYIEEMYYNELNETDINILSEVTFKMTEPMIEKIKSSPEYINVINANFDGKDPGYGEVFKFLKKYKYEALNALLKMVVDELDDYYVDNLNNCVKMMKDNYNYAIANKQEKCIYRPISLEELHTLLNEFFIEFDKTEVIGNIFANHVNNGKVKLEKKLYITQGISSSYNPITKELLIDYKGNTLDFIKIIHEFGHYLVDYYNSDCYLLVEFPSEYLEYLAAYFLVKKGYAKSIDEVLDFRNNDAITMLTSELSILNEYINHGNIDEEIMDKIVKEYLVRIEYTYEHLKEKIDKSSEFESIMTEGINADIERIKDDLVEIFISKNYFDSNNIVSDLDYSIGRYMTRKSLANLDNDKAFEIASYKIREIIKKYDKLSTSRLMRELNIYSPLSLKRTFK